MRQWGLMMLRSLMFMTASLIVCTMSSPNIEVSHLTGSVHNNIIAP
jgi:hypothetical protein